MSTQFFTAIKAFLLLTLITGVLYPLAITAVSQAVLDGAAEGSLLQAVSGSSPGSVLIGQSFQGQDQFWGRLSQTGPAPYNASASGASNLGTSNPALADNARARLEALGLEPGVRCPVDLVSSSGSGLDPDISPEAARVQIPRVARATGKSAKDLEALVDRLTQPPTFGVLGQARVNVVLLNQELKKLP